MKSCCCTFAQRSKLLDLGSTSKYFGYRSDYIRTHPQKERMHQLPAWQFARRQPIAQVLPWAYITRQHYASIFVHPRSHPSDMVTHSIEILLQHTLVTIVAIKFPRHNLQRSPPSYSAAAPRLPRSTIRNVSVNSLRTSDVTNPLIIESASIKIVHHSNACNLSISRIGRALTVGTITGY